MYSELPDHIHSSLVEQIFLDLWSKPGMIALIKEGKKKKSTLSLSHGIKAVKSSRARWHLAVLKPKWLVPVLEVKLELHSSLKFGVCIIIIIHGLKTPSSCLGYYMPPTLLVGPFFFFRCCCSSSSLFLRVLGLPCSLFRSWQFQFLEWFTFHR